MSPRRPRQITRFLLGQPLMLLSVIGLTVAIVLALGDQTSAVQIVAVTVIGVVIAAALVEMVRHLMASHFGLDILAIIAMIATLLVGEYIAGLIIAVMLTGGEALESLAARRASRELDALLGRAPAYAHRINPDSGEIEQIAVSAVNVGDELVVRSAEVLPVDGTLLSPVASIDESSVTGEPMPATYVAGDWLLSGTVNGSDSITLRAGASAADSQYATIVRLVEEAVDSKAPMVRLADRYAVPFTIAALLIAGASWWISGEAVRFAEVLVVATPCPLLIAAPVAFMGGMSSAARLNVIIKDGGALETLARVRSAALDKTGTLTQGHPEVVDILAVSLSADRTLQLAAAAEQYSVHSFAGPVVAHAHQRDLALPAVRTATEVATNGVLATMSDGTVVRVGKPSFIEQATGQRHRPQLAAEHSAVYVAANDQLAGVIVLSDPIRPSVAETIRRIRQAGVEQVAMVTGDVTSTAQSVATRVGIDTVHAEVSPQQKVTIVRAMQPKPVMMVGDGINDAPVLAAAEVGIAMAGRGSTAATESASAVVTSDSFTRVADVMAVARGTVRIALQSIWLGIVISVGLMLVAAFGYLPAVVGALLQEVVDLVAIASALRALRLYRAYASTG